MDHEKDDGTPMSESDRNATPLIYANWFAASPSPFELALDFGYQAPHMEEPQRTVRIVNTWEHAKLLKEILDQIIEQREANVGEISRPPGVEFSDATPTQAKD
jgi:hypothetical protein